VDAKQDLVLIDTNIFVIDLRYKRDAHYKTNQTFLDYIAKTPGNSIKPETGAFLNVAC